MPPFLVPTITPEQQRRRFTNNEIAHAVKTLTQEQIRTLDRKYRRGTKWLEIASAMLAMNRNASRKARRPVTPKPAKRFVVQTLVYSAGPLDHAILAGVESSYRGTLSFTEEDSYAAPPVLPELEPVSVFGDAIDFGSNQSDDDDKLVMDGLYMYAELES